MKTTQEQIKRFLELPSGNVSDANNKGGNMDAQIKPIGAKSKMVGPAYTAKCHPGDNLTIHKAIYEAPVGSVLVIDIDSYIGAGHFGEITAIACQQQGLAGVVIDGGCRDAAEIEEMGLPVFCRALNPGGTVKATLGKTNIPLECGGVIVNPGDIVVGDRDGVVVVSQEKVQTVFAQAEAIAEKEMKIKEMLLQGKSTLEIYGFDKIISNLEKIKG